MPEGLLDRLMLNEARIAQIAEGLQQVAALDDPFGRFFMERTSPIGSESPAICLKPSAIASIRAWVSLNLS